MASCILPDWVRCASSTKTKMLPLAAKSFGILACEFLDEVAFAPRRGCLVLGAAELVDQRADQPLGRLVQRVEQVGAALVR